VSDAGSKPVDLSALAGSLHALLDASDSTDAGWTEEDYGSLLEHQLSARLCEELAPIFSDVSNALADSKDQTFGDLLGAASPSLPALKMVRVFAKQMIARDDRSYPDEVARVLYFSAIAAAQIHGGERISKLEPAQLLDGYTWARGRSWLTSDLRALFDRAIPA